MWQVVERDEVVRMVTWRQNGQVKECALMLERAE